ncbi:alkene reductase [Tomitella fengzijianii]|uniref:Alkene reductase n=1 Tax=Tomitella fengzijianii TaxID=2597660 RepID=A0A516X630_9ACTN|nr:alkene reductase [Tomitella fengzijianii]QDQ98528.1 alkene reductase [Tomitella fengzijianii]
MTTAFDPIDLGGRTLRNRIAMAPMTRSRAYGDRNSPTADTVTYYAQRSGAGLIVTEGTQPSVIGQGYPYTPGLHDDVQVRAWQRVTEAVHSRGGTIFAQLMHTGRVGHPSTFPTPQSPVGPSPVRAAGQVFTSAGMQDFVEPRQLTAAQVESTIEDFTLAARNAIAAGFDGVELHGANGYLLHQFLSTNANRRTDRWGGTAVNRSRMVIETTRAVAAAIGAPRTALRLSPANPLNDIVEDDHRQVYPLILHALDGLGLAYLHILESVDPDFTPELRRAWSGQLMLNPATPGGRTGPEHLALIDSGAADLVSFGQSFIANPDLPARLRADAPLAVPDMSQAYAGDHHGYTTYPAMTGAADPAAAAV